MDGGTPVGPFSWYDQRAPGACPPKSLFIIIALMLAGMTLPLAGLWMLGHFMALAWLAGLGALLVAALLFDVLATYRRYKNWGGQWLCGDCRAVFNLPTARQDNFV